jgi:hypothetical protein
MNRRRRLPWDRQSPDWRLCLLPFAFCVSLPPSPLAVIPTERTDEAPLFGFIFLFLFLFLFRVILSHARKARTVRDLLLPLSSFSSSATLAALSAIAVAVALVAIPTERSNEGPFPVSPNQKHRTIQAGFYCVGPKHFWFCG